MPILRKKRQIPKELRILRFLNARMVLLDQDRKNYFNAEKGFEGEKKFDLLTEKLVSDCIVINGLLLKADNTFYQIDTVIIFQKTIYLIDVKNHENNYQFEGKHLQHIKTGKIINDPYIQLQRCETLFRQLLQKLGFIFNVEAFLVFINPEFTLYQAPFNPSIIFPTQVNRFIKTLNKLPSKLNSGNEKLADLLLSMDIGDYPYAQLPNYNYEQLEKGVISPCCWTFMTPLSRERLICPKCGLVEKVDSAVLRSVEEFRMLFPDRKITTTEIYKWCKVIKSRRAIMRILLNNYQLCGKGRYSFFV